MLTVDGSDDRGLSTGRIGGGNVGGGDSAERSVSGGMVVGCFGDFAVGVGEGGGSGVMLQG